MSNRRYRLIEFYRGLYFKPRHYKLQPPSVVSRCFRPYSLLCLHRRCKKFNTTFPETEDSVLEYNIINVFITVSTLLFCTYHIVWESSFYITKENGPITIYQGWCHVKCFDLLLYFPYLREKLISVWFIRVPPPSLSQMWKF